MYIYHQVRGAGNCYIPYRWWYGNTHFVYAAIITGATKKQYSAGGWWGREAHIEQLIVVSIFYISDVAKDFFQWLQSKVSILMGWVHWSWVPIFSLSFSNTLQLNCGKSTHCNMNNELEGRRRKNYSQSSSKSTKLSVQILWSGCTPYFPLLLANYCILHLKQRDSWRIRDNIHAHNNQHSR